ncbi:MAG: TetR family transcriptional regulator [Propionibacteriaceae bacterium]
MTTDQAVTTRRRAATRARLLSAAREVIAEKGAGGATVEGIAERAGFTRGAFYSNYSDLDELIVDLIRDVGEVRLRDVREAANQFALNRTPGLTIDSALAGGVREFVHLLQPPMQDVLLQAELRLYALRHDGARGEYVAVVRQTMTGVYEILESLCSSVNARIRTTPGITMEILLGFFDQGSAMSYLDLGRIDADAQVERLSQLVDVIIEADGTC